MVRDVVQEPDRRSQAEAGNLPKNRLEFPALASGYDQRDARACPGPRPGIASRPTAFPAQLAKCLKEAYVVFPRLERANAQNVAMWQPERRGRFSLCGATGRAKLHVHAVRNDTYLRFGHAQKLVNSLG